MKVSFSEAATSKILDVAEFIDGINTQGAGDRWAERLIEFVEDYAKLKKVQWPLCRNQNLAEKAYSCLVYKNWVIAFRIEENIFKVYDFILGSLLE